MKIVRSFKQLGREIVRIPRILDRSRKEVMTDIVESFEAFANYYVPKQTGALAMSISPRKMRNGWKVTAGRTGNLGFNVGGFTNMEFGLDIKKPNHYFLVGQRFMYGQTGVLSGSGKPINWNKDGKEGWWFKSAKETNDMYRPEIVMKRINARIMSTSN